MSIVFVISQADDNPPFSIDTSIVEDAFSGLNIRLLDTQIEPEGDRGEQVWLIKANA